MHGGRRRSQLRWQWPHPARGAFQRNLDSAGSGRRSGAIGAALATWYQYEGKPRVASNREDAMKGSYLGPEFSDTKSKSS